MESVINEEIFDTVNAIRLACKGDRLPHYYSTRGTTLFTTDKGDNTFFFFLQWTNWQTEESQIVPCNKEEAFHFLYDLYGSSYTDTTDEDLDEILKKYFPNRTIAG
ncbi:MAG: hypothetical protein WA421_15540 [Nitrososphaeraceae archaeon]